MMRRILLIFLTLSLFSLIFVMNIGQIHAFQLITAQEAFDMVQNEQATIIDVRTLEEYVFVGSPALESGGDPIAYLIPWKIFDGIDESGNKKFKNNPDFEALVTKTFGMDKDQGLIMMCACGIRSTFASEKLESMGYTNVYEVDNQLLEIASYPGGQGGFEGSTHNNVCGGYKGYPGRPEDFDSNISVATVTSLISSEKDSVSWMDTGLPITYIVDPDKIPKIEKAPSTDKGSKTSVPFQWSVPFVNYPWMTNTMNPFLFSVPSYQTSFRLPYGIQSIQHSWYQTSMLGYPFTNLSSASETLLKQFSTLESCAREAGYA